jgi:hypothetical protein
MLKKCCYYKKYSWKTIFIEKRLEPGETKFFGHGHDDLAMDTVTMVMGRGRDHGRESRPLFLICRDSQFLPVNYVYRDEG